MGQGRPREVSLPAAGRILRDSRPFAPGRAREKSFHGGQTDQRRRGRDRQRAGDGLLPRNRRGGWRSGRELSKICPHYMTRNVEQLWAKTFHYAKLHSPFYRELFHGVTAVPPLTAVPPVDKTTLSARNLDFLCVPRERIVEIVTTSGTTCSPLLWMLTEADLN